MDNKKPSNKITFDSHSPRPPRPEKISRTIGEDKLRTKRISAYMLHQLGWSSADIAVSCMVAKRTVNGWIKAMRDSGEMADAGLPAIQLSKDHMSSLVPLAITAYGSFLDPDRECDSDKLRAATNLLRSHDIIKDKTDININDQRDQHATDDILLAEAERIIATGQAQARRDNEGTDEEAGE